MLEIDDTALRLEMRMDPHEVVHYQREPNHLLAKRYHDLIELHLVKHLFIVRSDVLAKTSTVDEYLNIRTLHLLDVLPTLNGILLVHLLVAAF